MSGDLALAQDVLSWLQSWPDTAISLPDIYQRGPNKVRDLGTARRLVDILEQHGHLLPIPGGAMVRGLLRREVWAIMREPVCEAVCERSLSLQY